MLVRDLLVHFVNSFEDKTSFVLVCSNKWGWAKCRKLYKNKGKCNLKEAKENCQKTCNHCISGNLLKMSQEGKIII